MIRKTLKRLRTGLQDKQFTLKKVSDLSGVPIPTIADMKKESWSNRTLDNLEAIGIALDQLEEEASEARS